MLGYAEYGAWLTKEWSDGTSRTEWVDNDGTRGGGGKCKGKTPVGACQGRGCALGEILSEYIKK